MRTKLIRTLFITTGILLIPPIAMQFTTEVNWDRADFIVAGVVLIGVQLVFYTLAAFVPKKYKILVGVIVFLLLALVWAELAVGIFNSPWAGS